MVSMRIRRIVLYIGKTEGLPNIYIYIENK